MTNKEILAQRISALREEAKVTRQKAADDLGVTRAALEFYEKGKRTPDVGMIARLAEYYGVSTDYLLGVVDFRNPENEKPATELHLSEKAVENLHKCNQHNFTAALNCFLESDEFFDIVRLLEQCFVFLVPVDRRYAFLRYLAEKADLPEAEEQFDHLFNYLAENNADGEFIGALMTAVWLPNTKQGINNLIDQFLVRLYNDRKGNAPSFIALEQSDDDNTQSEDEE